VQTKQLPTSTSLYNTLTFCTNINHGIWILKKYPEFLWWHMPLYLLLIKLPSNFSCSLKVLHEALLSSYVVRSLSSSCCHMVRADLYNFCCLNFLFYMSLVLTADKVMVIFHSGMKCRTKHYSLLEVKFPYSHHINCFSGRVFTDMRQLLRLLSGKLLHTCKDCNILLVYWHTSILITWEYSTPSIPRSWKNLTSLTNFCKCC
jgi:hypothetical protein